MVNNRTVFEENFHMSVEQFNDLFEKLHVHLQPLSATRKDAILPMHKLAAVLE